MTAPTPALPPVTDLEAWLRELAALGVREKAAFPFMDVLPYGRQENWQGSPEGWPQSATYDTWLGSEEVAALYGTGARA